MELSSRRGGSVNDGISSKACSVSYLSVDEAVRICWRMGKEMSLVKLSDIQSAYRIVPVHPADRHPLGVAWQGNVFGSARHGSFSQRSPTHCCGFVLMYLCTSVPM